MAKWVSSGMPDLFNVRKTTNVIKLYKQIKKHYFLDAETVCNKIQY